jgi:hypothetical protein
MKRFRKPFVRSTKSDPRKEGNAAKVDDTSLVAPLGTVQAVETALQTAPQDPPVMAFASTTTDFITGSAQVDIHVTIPPATLNGSVQ